VQRVWSENEIKPHLTRVFKLSTDPDFEAKFWDVIGLYLNPPEARGISAPKPAIRGCTPKPSKIPLGCLP